MPSRHRLVHAITPRYTLFSLKKNDIGFDMFEGEIYWQGIANYGLWVLTAVLSLVVAITLRALYLKGMCLYPPEKPIRHKIKTFVTAMSFICIKLSVLGLIALLMGYGSWEKFNKQLVQAPLHNSACTLLKKLGPLENKLRDLLNQGVNSNQAAAEVAKRFNKTELMEQAPKHCEALENDLSTLTEPLMNATHPLRKLCLPEKTPSKIVIKPLLTVCLFGVILCLWTILLCVMIFRSFHFRSTLIMTILCISAFIAVILWGMVASVSFMAYLSVADFCYNPMKPATMFIKELNAEVSSQLVAFYLECKAENPLQKNFKPLKTALENMTETSNQLAKIFETPILTRHGVYAKDFDMELTESLRIAKDIADSNCPASKKDFDKLVNIPCRHIFWSLATLFVVAMFITLLYTAFVIIAMQIRKFVYKFLPPLPPPPPNDVCPNTCKPPTDPGEVPLYHMPPVAPPPADLECPPSCKAFPKVLRKLTQGLSKEVTKRREEYACAAECDKIYLDEYGKPIPPECIVVSHMAVETENAYMCNKSASRRLRNQKLEKERGARKKRRRSRRKSKKKPSEAEMDAKRPNKISFESGTKNQAPTDAENIRKKKSKALSFFRSKTTNKKNPDVPDNDNAERKKSKANLQKEAGKSKCSAKAQEKKSPCTPDYDQSKDGNCGFAAMRRNNSNVKDAHMGLKCTNCPCARKKRSRKSRF